MKKNGLVCVPLRANDRFTRLWGESDKKKGLKAGLVMLKPSESIGEHATHNKEEAIIILKGTARVFCQGRSRLVRANTFLCITPYTQHNIKNAGKKPLYYVYVTAPL